MVFSAPAPDDRRQKPSRRSKSDLSEARYRLVESMQRINFGRIERLTVVSGQPMLGSAAKVVSTHKLKGENGPRVELNARDFLLKQEVIELFRILDELQDGLIDVIEVKYGLPFLVEVAEVLA
ncbi:MAG: hypothetical protein ACKO3T_08270 [Planctomycetaceae bacterium]